MVGRSVGRWSEKREKLDESAVESRYIRIKQHSCCQLHMIAHTLDIGRKVNALRIARFNANATERLRRGLSGLIGVDRSRSTLIVSNTRRASGEALVAPSGEHRAVEWECDASKADCDFRLCLALCLTSHNESTQRGVSGDAALARKKRRKKKRRKERWERNRPFHKPSWLNHCERFS